MIREISPEFTQPLKKVEELVIRGRKQLTSREYDLLGNYMKKEGRAR